MFSQRNALAALLLTGLVVLAGCSGGGGTTPESTTASAATTAATTDQPTAASANATVVKRAATAAMADVETYRVDADIVTDISSNNVQRRTVTNSTGVIDRAENELRINRTASVAGQSNTVATYVVDETLYQRSPSFTRAFSSKWIRQDVSENFSRQWSALDTLTRQRELLNISTVELAGEETVDGTETYVLEAHPDAERYGNLTANATNRQVGSVRNISVTYWIATDTHLPVKSTTTINSTVTLRGQEMDLHQELALRFSEYDEDASIRLPPAAETAVSIGNRTNTTTTRTTTA